MYVYTCINYIQIKDLNLHGAINVHYPATYPCLLYAIDFLCVFYRLSQLKIDITSWLSITITTDINIKKILMEYIPDMFNLM